MQIIKKPTNCQFGFSLIEVMLSIVLLGGGLLALATGLSQGMILVSTAHHHQIAKEKASEAMESVFTSRDARKIVNWNQIQNVRNGGIFLDGPCLLREQGPDGLVNTQDDGAPEVYIDPGPDNTLGTGDDKQVSLTEFQREIEIVNLNPNLRQIRITVTYTVGGLTRQYQLTACISPFA